jgi:alpha-glucosidase/alpha-D-xyloside xylohydrolase
MTSTTRMALTALAALAVLGHAAQQAKADPVRYWSQDAELTVSQVSDHTVRLFLAPLDEQGKPQPAPPSTVLVQQQFPVKLRLRDLNGPQKIAVGQLTVAVKTAPLTIIVEGPNGKKVQELVLNESDGSVAFHTGAPVLGLGEGDKQFDRAGNLYPVVNGQVKSLATHGSTIRVPLLIGTEGWALFVHQPLPEIDLREGRGILRPAKGTKNSPATKNTQPLDLFVIDVPEPAVAMAEYVRLSGKPVMPPKWTMGYMQSHRTLAGPEEPLQIAKTFREKKLPCDALIYLGTGYCPAGWNVGHGTFTFNPKTFDRPAENLKALQNERFKVILHINHAPRNMFGASVAEKSDSPIHISNYWAKHLDLVMLGVDGWWPDDGDELPIEARLARHRCYYEGPLQERPNERPWSLNRNGYAGVQRYGGWIWSGDVQSSWATLKAHVPVGVNTSLSLTPFWGTDTGGFVPTKELTGELYARWFQFSTFNPLMRSHGRTWKLRLPWGWNRGELSPQESPARPDESELHNAAIEPICRKFLELRYSLLPYNYTLIRQAHDTGLPPMRALWLHYPGDPEAVKLGDEYLWGRDVLVAPVVEKGATERSLYLPPGDWYDWWTGEKLAGKRWIKRSVDLATMPLYARAGAIIPIDPVRQYTSQAVTEPTTLKVYRGADGQFALYDDDGKSLDYLKGKATWTAITWNNANGQLVIEPDARNTVGVQGEREFDVLVLPEMAKKRVIYQGKRVEVKF